MKTIGRLGQHLNLVPLRAYYYSKDEKLLVNSLATVLHVEFNHSRSYLALGGTDLRKVYEFLSWLIQPHLGFLMVYPWKHQKSQVHPGRRYGYRYSKWDDKRG